MMKLMSWIFGLSIGEAILLSEHLMAAKMHAGRCLCCVSRGTMGTTWVYLFVVRENEIQYIDYYTLEVWAYYLRGYGVSFYGWLPAEQVLPISVIQKVKAK